MSVAEGMVVERHFEFMVDNPGAVLGVSQSEFVNRSLFFDDTIRKYQKMLGSSGEKKYSDDIEAHLAALEQLGKDYGIWYETR